LIHVIAEQKKLERVSRCLPHDGSFLSLDILRLAGPFVPLLFAILLRLRTGRNFLLRHSLACGSPFPRPAPASQRRDFG